MATQRFPRMKLWRAVDRVYGECEQWILGYSHELQEHYTHYHVRSRPAERRALELESRIASLQDLAGDLLRVREKIAEFL